MNPWLVLAAGGLLTFTTRFSFIYLLGRAGVPEWLRRALRYVPPAVLTAIIFPEILLVDGALSVSLENFRLLAGIAAALMAWRTKNALLTVVVGMLILWLLPLLF